MGVKEFAAGGLLEAGGLPWAGVEGQLSLPSGPSGFNFNARYVLFRPDGAIGNGDNNNDYLVWGATATSVPEPGTLTLLGLGLAGVRFARRRKELTA
jgi:PEP-CTERM motif